MMTEVGGKLKAGLLVASVALFGVLAFSARTADIVKIKGEACEKFVPGQSKSSIRVRVTDKASYKAVSQVENLADVRSRMLEHDFNVIVYNLVDNYVRDLMVRTTSQNDKELCVKVTGALLASDIDTVVANYSPNTPAPEYDIKEAAGIEEEVLTEGAGRAGRTRRGGSLQRSRRTGTGTAGRRSGGNGNRFEHGDFAGR